ncbi:cyclohexanone monooxygenase [Corynespora cassiicola Philippines]|uniref:Cyclohexanone monooxygenase n=1 Tax=Corynespora cassiicola Philippines TaxID=1448308 RepID=A0A2T2N4L4_CORCC|nr:cyclohexanone monooxygenase [Corynespora cassiicola Philippines]
MVQNFESNTLNGNHAPYRILDQYHSKPSHVKVICAGAGMTGLYLAYRMQKTMKNYSLTIYEKNKELGGTWFENRYPGCACDVPSHIYTYSFRPNPNVSNYYAGSAELLQYFKDFSDEFGLDKYIQYETKVLEAVYDEDEGIWNVRVAHADGSEKWDTCHVFINAAGILNNYRWPDIPNREGFQGKVLHTAAWDETVDWIGKKVAVIGTGSSAIQVTPKVQQGSEKVTAFIRSPTWIAPQLGGLPSLDADPVKEGNTKVNNIMLRGSQPFQFTEEDKEEFRKNPDLLLELRKKMELILCSHVDIFRVGTERQKQNEKYWLEQMMAKLKDHEELRKRIVPNFPSGCRRLTPGQGYLEALLADNVSQCYETITEFTPKGLKTADGQEHEFDLIICATGFNVAFTPFFQLRGRNGQTIQDAWQDDPRAYLGIAAAGFPNCFTVLGPRGPWGNGSIIPAAEINIDYILTMIGKMQKQQIKSFEIRQEAVDDFCEHVDEWHKGSVWGSKCRSWYKRGADPNAKPLLWCGMSPSYYKTMRDVRLEDYKFEYKHRNRFAYLGNGHLRADQLPEKERMMAITQYIRNSDEPWDLE